MTLALADNSIQLVPDGTLILHVILIILMVFILNITLFRPINRILEERERRTRGRSGEAQDILRRVESSIGQYERSLREARAEGYHLLEQQRTEAMRERQAGLSSLREELSRSVEEQKGTIQTQKDQARTALGDDARRIAAQIRSQILHRPANW
jgi:F-type H+-transporting ATPase subunit b